MPRNLAVVRNKAEDRGLALFQHAQEVMVVDQYTYEFAATFLSEVKVKQKEVEAALEPQCKSAYDSWQTALAQKKLYLKPFQEAEAIVKGKMAQYQLEQRKTQEEAERLAMEEAERQAEKERQALLKKASKTKNEDKAEELRQQAEQVFVPAIAADHTVTKVSGVAATDTVDISVVGIREFLAWLATGPMDPDTVVTIKTAPLKQYLKLCGENKIPGCQITKNVRISATGR